jgi:molybdate transport system substrate-binding protein
MILLAGYGPAGAEPIRVAVASNFTHAMQDIATRFEQQSGHRVVLAFGSTGKHYAQIKNGAPFEAFFAADVRRPRLLEEEDIALPGSRFTYAIGKVVLWSPDPAVVDARGRVLDEGTFRHLAMANPRLAPYGRAAQQIMQAKGVWKALRGRIVRGENIAQPYQFVKSGNAQLGFVAYAQIKRPGERIHGSYWEPPRSLYEPIEQQAVLLQNNSVARQFLDYIRGPQAQKVIRDYGYDTP